MPKPQKIWTLTPPAAQSAIIAPLSNSIYRKNSLTYESDGEDASRVPNDPQLWVWLLRDGKHLMSMSARGILRVWNLHTSVIVGQIPDIGKPLCWDYTVDDDGVTIIVNVESDGQYVSLFTLSQPNDMISSIKCNTHLYI
jgi:hypothetical protein